MFKSTTRLCVHGIFRKECVTRGWMEKYCPTMSKLRSWHEIWRVLIKKSLRTATIWGRFLLPVVRLFVLLVESLFHAFPINLTVVKENVMQLCLREVITPHSDERYKCVSKQAEYPKITSTVMLTRFAMTYVQLLQYSAPNWFRKIP